VRIVSPPGSDVASYKGSNGMTRTSKPGRYRYAARSPSRRAAGSSRAPKSGKGRNVKELLGHADMSLTLNVYSHILPDMGDAASGAMDAALG
jgi:integrase